ncbi:MAG: hypothetical protein ACO38Z_03565 [Candidatus Nanopelagicales bacterium]
MTKTRIAAVVAAVALGAGTVTGATMALAADGQPSAPVHSERGVKDGHGNDQGPGAGPGQMREGRGGPLLHSEGVAEDAEGNFITVRMQHGEVTSSTVTSLTVKSADGYTSTYVVDDQTRLEREGDEGAPEVGDLVHVRATVDAGTATAVGVHALSPEKAAELQERRDGAGGRGHEGRGRGGPGDGGPGHGGPGAGGPGHGGPGHGGPADMGADDSTKA